MSSQSAPAMRRTHPHPVDRPRDRRSLGSSTACRPESRTIAASSSRRQPSSGRHHREPPSPSRADCPARNAGEAADAGAPVEPHQQRLRLVVFMVAGEERPIRRPAASIRRERRIARLRAPPPGVPVPLPVPTLDLASAACGIPRSPPQRLRPRTADSPALSGRSRDRRSRRGSGRACGRRQQEQGEAVRPSRNRECPAGPIPRRRARRGRRRSARRSCGSGRSRRDMAPA
jgi:hypothetical protein